MTDKHLRHAWKHLHPSDLVFGRAAYQTYHDLCRVWARHYGFGFVQTVEAFAALSPNNDYHGNIRSLTSCMEGLRQGLPDDRITVSTYGTMKRKALAVLRGDVSFLDTTSGPKIRAFRECILYVEDARQPVIDGHMAALWHGERMTMRDAAKALQGAGYARIAADVIRLARKHGIAVCAAQAALWAYQKRTHGVLFDPQLELFSGATRWDEIPRPEDYPAFAPQPENAPGAQNESLAQS